jgi:hypothetical protein
MGPLEKAVAAAQAVGWQVDIVSKRTDSGRYLGAILRKRDHPTHQTFRCNADRVAHAIRQWIDERHMAITP